VRLLLVHGRAQEGKSPEIIRDEWMTALRRGFAVAGVREPPDITIDVPFYGDKLEELLRHRDLPQADNVATRGDAVDDGYAEFLRDVAIQASENGIVTDQELDLELRGPQERAPENWAWVQAIIRVVDRRATGVASFSIGKLLRDVFIYVNDRPVRRAINAIVAEKLTGEPTVVVAHSLGSVVAYEVLRAHVGNMVPRYVTVGSPLGIRAISQRLATPLVMPAGAADWYNAFDPHDVVALYPLDAANFAIAPPIKNYPYVNNHTDNRHGIGGYLDDADVAAQIATAFRSN
jgi:hypothetical protein